MTTRNLLNRRAHAPADCGWCGLEGPDAFGNYDLHEHPECPVHGAEPAANYLTPSVKKAKEPRRLSPFAFRRAAGRRSDWKGDRA